MKTFHDMAAFYAARGGEFSRESDYGVQWTAADGFPWWRVSYVKETGDVYAWRQNAGAGDRVILLGTVPPLPTSDTDFNTAWDKPLDDALPEWWAVCGKPFSLQWAIERLAGFPPSTRCALQPELQATLASNDAALD